MLLLCHVPELVVWARASFVPSTEAWPDNEQPKSWGCGLKDCAMHCFNLKLQRSHIWEMWQRRDVHSLCGAFFWLTCILDHTSEQRFGSKLLDNIKPAGSGVILPVKLWDRPRAGDQWAYCKKIGVLSGLLGARCSSKESNHLSRHVGIARASGAICLLQIRTCLWEVAEFFSSRCWSCRQGKPLQQCASFCASPCHKVIAGSRVVASCSDMGAHASERLVGQGVVHWI